MGAHDREELFRKALLHIEKLQPDVTVEDTRQASMALTELVPTEPAELKR